MAAKELSPARVKRTYKERLAKGEGVAQSVARKPLLPWEFLFAEWLARQHPRPSMQEQIEKAQELLQKTVSPRTLRNLRDRKEFREYFGKLQANEYERAKARVEKRFDRYIDAHDRGLEIALELDDHRAIPQYTLPMIDRAMPKKQDIAAVTAIKIELTPRQQQLIEGEAVEVSVEQLDDNKR